jgi:hypothetical protein
MDGKTRCPHLPTLWFCIVLEMRCAFKFELFEFSFTLNVLKCNTFLGCQADPSIEQNNSFPSPHIVALGNYFVFLLL